MAMDISFSKNSTVRVSPNEPPVVIGLRDNEQMIVDSVQGTGKLMLSACTVLGEPVVKKAIVFDSNAFFWKHPGEKIQLNHKIRGNSLLVHSLWAQDGNGIDVHLSHEYYFEPGQRVLDEDTSQDVKAEKPEPPRNSTDPPSPRRVLDEEISQDVKIEKPKPPRNSTVLASPRRGNGRPKR